jgi:hypothetical protein
MFFIGFRSSTLATFRSQSQQRQTPSSRRTPTLNLRVFHNHSYSTPEKGSQKEKKYTHSDMENILPSINDGTAAHPTNDSAPAAALENYSGTATKQPSFISTLHLTGKSVPFLGQHDSI